MINTMGLTEIFSILDNLYEAEFIQRFVHEKKKKSFVVTLNSTLVYIDDVLSSNNRYFHS